MSAESVRMGIFILMAVGISGFLIGLGFFLNIVLKMRKTLSEMDETLKSMSNEIEELAPRISSSLHSVEVSAEDLGRTANAVTTVVNRFTGKTDSSSALDGAFKFLPAAFAVGRIITSIVSKHKRGK